MTFVSGQQSLVLFSFLKGKNTKSRFVEAHTEVRSLGRATKNYLPSKPLQGRSGIFRWNAVGAPHDELVSVEAIPLCSPSICRFFLTTRSRRRDHVSHKLFFFLRKARTNNVYTRGHIPGRANTSRAAEQEMVYLRLRPPSSKTPNQATQFQSGPKQVTKPDET